MKLDQLVSLHPCLWWWWPTIFLVWCTPAIVVSRGSVNTETLDVNFMRSAIGSVEKGMEEVEVSNVKLSRKLGYVKPTTSTARPWGSHQS